jgi:hypothetical protein
VIDADRHKSLDPALQTPEYMTSPVNLEEYGCYLMCERDLIPLKLELARIFGYNPRDIDD